MGDTYVELFYITEKESQTKMNNNNKVLLIVSLLILIMIDKINQKLP